MAIFRFWLESWFGLRFDGDRQFLPNPKEKNSVRTLFRGEKMEAFSTPNYTKSGQSTDWEIARLFAQDFRQVSDLDKLAAQYYKQFPCYPPDPFDRIVWGHPEKLRFYNRSSAKWFRANEAVSPTGLITRLSDQLVIPTFITFPLTEIGFTSEDSSFKNYQDKIFMTEVKKALKEQIAGSAWYSLEVSRGEFSHREGSIHPHVLLEHDAYGFDAFSKLIYEPKGLYKYLIKGIPYNAENLAVYWKAKKVLPEGKQLVRKTGTIRVSYSKN